MNMLIINSENHCIQVTKDDQLILTLQHMGIVIQSLKEMVPVATQNVPR